MKNSPQNLDQNTLQTLPEEVILVILNYLDPRELVNFEQTCHSFNKLTAKDWIWKELLDKHAPLAKNLSRLKYDNAPRELFQELFSDKEIAKKVQLETVWGSIKSIFTQFCANSRNQITQVFQRLAAHRMKLMIFAALLLSIITSELLLLFVFPSHALIATIREALIAFIIQSGQFTNIFSTILAGALLVFSTFAYDTLKAIRNRIFHPYDVYCYKSYLTFSMNIRRSNVTETHQKYQAANAGIEAAMSWRGWGKSMLFMPAWRQNRAFVAGKVAKQQNDNEFIQRCKARLVA
ncbi:MAG: F-box-like domain-containing protein [Proteobacteria bacterium]|nr:F-box-like domain-containing protein [Pseudomonadota bacterium]